MLTDAEKKAIEDAAKEIKTKQGELLEALGKKADATVIEEFKKNLTDAEKKANDLVAALEEKLLKQGEEITKLKAGEHKEVKHKSLSENFVEIFTKNHESIKQLVNTKGSMNFATKAAITMTESAAYNSGTGIALTMLDPIVGIIAKREPFLRQLVNVAQTSSPLIKYIDQVAADQFPTSPNTAYMVAEGAAKVQRSLKYIESTATVRKIAPYTKVSEEMLADLSFMRGEINNDLMREVALALDYQLLSGDNTGQNLKGILEFASTFAAIGLTTDATIFDAMLSGVVQVRNQFFQPDYILMNPSDAGIALMNKTSVGEYTAPSWVTINNGLLSIAGVPVVQNPGIAQDTFLVGDFSKSNLRVREDINFKVGYENDDFTKNLVTIIAELRATHYIKANHTDAFVKGDLSDAIHDLNS